MSYNGSRRIKTLVLTFPSNASIPVNRCVQMDPAHLGGICVPPTYASIVVPPIGVTNEVSDANKFQSVTIMGIAPVESDGVGTISAGDIVGVTGTGADGRVATVVSAAPAAPQTTANWKRRFTLGTCVSTQQVPATAGALVDVLINPQTYLGA